jgi:membrane fusion protein, heavy metal efflux system
MRIPLWAGRVGVPRLTAGICVLGLVVCAVGVLALDRSNIRADEAPAKTKTSKQTYVPTAKQWETLSVELVGSRAFRSQVVTDAKIAVNEDNATPIFSPYSGRVGKLSVRPGDIVVRDQLLFTVEATDMVQAQNDFMAAAANLSKANSQLNLARTVEKRQHELYDGKAVALKDWQQSQADLAAAQSDLQSAEVALEATRNRLRLLGKSDDEIAQFQTKGTINPVTPILAPIPGLIVQRKVGPGQYVTSGSSDPVFVIGDPSTVWLVANVRESDASHVRVGQAIEFRVIAFGDRKFSGTVDYVSSAVDPVSRRLQVRATIDNSDGLLKPEMFATASIVTAEEGEWPAIPANAIVYEGDTAKVWIVTSDGGIALRKFVPGLTNDRMVQVRGGLQAGEKIITKGSLFIDRVSTDRS